MVESEFNRRLIMGTYQNYNSSGLAGDYRPIHVNQSGHLILASGAHVISDVNVEVSSGLFVDGVSGVHVYVESGVWVAGVSLSGLDIQVNISGDPVSISGQPIDITSGAVVVDSGLYVHTQSGLHVEQVDYVQVLQSGAVVVDSGLHVWISGQHVYQESGAFIQGVITSGSVRVNGGTVNVVGGVDVSGSHVWISGQHVYQESGYVGIVEVLSGAYVVTDAGAAGSGQVVHIGCADDARVGDLRAITAASGGASLCLSGYWCSGIVHSIIVKSLSGNQDIFIGHVNCKPYSGRGFMLSDQEAINLDVCDICNVYACANISGNRLTYIGTDY